MSAITAAALTRVFGAGPNAVTAVRDASMQVERGEVVLLLGPSGSGKTTFVSMLAGLLRPTSGSVTIDGTNLSGDAAQSAGFRLRTIGFVFQSFNLLPALNAVENVAMPLMLRGERRSNARRAAAALLEQLGLRDRLHASPRVLRSRINNVSRRGS